MESDEVLNRIMNFLASLPSWRGEIEPDTPILETGQLDSLGIISLVAYISDELGAEIPESDFTFERFATPRSIVDMVQHGRAGITSV